MIRWHDRLVQEVARRKCVAFLGAGVSRQSQDAEGARPPLWKEFLELALTRCEGSLAEMKKYLKSGDFLTACQLIRARLGDHDWHDLLEEVFARPNYGGAEIHQHIFSLDLPIVATTNIDQIYDRFLAANYAGAVVSKNYHDDALGRYVKGDASTRLVLKVHGSVDNPGLAVFTREQYAEARTKYVSFYETLSALIITQTFIFLGYGIADPDIQLLLENNARLFKSPTPHYFITSDRVSTDIISMFERNYSTKIINYSEKDNHKELSDSLAQLVEAVSSARIKLAEKQIW